jgi:hypothetical protein
MGGPYRCERTTAFCDRDRATTLSDLVEQREALGLELGYAYGSMFHGA